MSLNSEDFSRLRDITAQSLGVDISEIDDASSPETIESWTSLNHLTLMSAVESEFGLRFSMEEMGGVKDFPSLAALVARHRAA